MLLQKPLKLSNMPRLFNVKIQLTLSSQQSLVIGYQYIEI